MPDRGDTGWSRTPIRSAARPDPSVFPSAGLLAVKAGRASVLDSSRRAKPPKGIMRHRDLPRLTPRSDVATIANRVAAVFVGIMGLCVAGLLAYAITLFS